MIETVNTVSIAKVPSGAAASSIVRIGTSLDSICIIAPATVDAGTWVLKASADGVTFANVNDGTSDITLPAAGKARIYLGWKFPYLQITGPTAAADRNWAVCHS